MSYAATLANPAMDALHAALIDCNAENIEREIARDPLQIAQMQHNPYVYPAQWAVDDPGRIKSEHLVRTWECLHIHTTPAQKKGLSRAAEIALNLGLYEAAFWALDQGGKFTVRHEDALTRGALLHPGNIFPQRIRNWVYTERAKPLRIQHRLLTIAALQGVPSEELEAMRISMGEDFCKATLKEQLGAVFLLQDLAQNEGYIPGPQASSLSSFKWLMQHFGVQDLSNIVDNSRHLAHEVKLHYLDLMRANKDGMVLEMNTVALDQRKPGTRL